jgi:hypothetical protein
MVLWSSFQLIAMNHEPCLEDFGGCSGESSIQTCKSSQAELPRSWLFFAGSLEGLDPFRYQGNAFFMNHSF